MFQALSKQTYVASGMQIQTLSILAESSHGLLSANLETIIISSSYVNDKKLQLHP